MLLKLQLKEFKKLKLLFSGKNKHHSLKSQIIIDISNGKIISTAFCFGSIHDFKLLLKSKTFIHPEKQVFVDSGYQGIQNIHKNTFLPFKKSKYNQLTPIQKEYNKTLSKIRIKIEHVFAKLKRFKILSLKYRNKIRRFALRFNLIAGIYNFELPWFCTKSIVIKISFNCFLVSISNFLPVNVWYWVVNNCDWLVISLISLISLFIVKVIVNFWPW
ncbi:transposase family protein [Spiroplasma endosymbiont of Zeiraphera isertana]|uniref:transposase family protein n=1 Tax=Spiroplasma endosymbiont of Zeiraphera isertana TaxID=3066313 RepID=UPI00313C8779